VSENSSNLINDKRRLHILNEVGLSITQLLDLQEILNYTQNLVIEKLGVSEFLIYLWSDENKSYEMRHSYGVGEETIEEISQKRQAGNDLVQQIADNRKTIFIPNLNEDDRFGKRIRGKYENHYYFGFPLVSRQLVIGVIELISPALPKYEQESVYFLESLGRQIGVAIDNAMLVSKARKQQEDAMTLYELGTKISSSLILSEVLEAVAESARTLVSTDIGVVGLYQESSKEIKIWAANGEGGKKLEGITIFVEEPGPGKTLSEGNFISGNIMHSSGPEIIRRYDFDLKDFESYLIVPLLHEDKFFGIIGVLSKKIRKFSENDLQLLKYLGYHVFVAIEDARLHQQLRYAATLEEQNRLARELHDNMAQALGYIKIKAIMANDMLEKQDYIKTQAHLNELIKTISVLYTDIRESIFNLRNTGSAQVDFLQGLEEYLSEYRHKYGLDVRFSFDDATSLEFPPEVANHLIRILQEALSNVRRHSCAQRVWINCRQGHGEILISVEDDGSGFDVEKVDNTSKQSFGLQIMKERVEYINGSIEIESTPGKGTKILLRLPSVYIR
jgi:signal transduction histidine kinase